jgi:5-(carboxyamino)imidazole ribonucleotide synthase
MQHQKLGILGGGQLGLLLTQAAMRFPVSVSVYDPDPSCSAAGFTDRFVRGDFSDFEKILAFGLDQDAVIFETEQVCLDAILELEKKGVRVYSSPQTLSWISDKALQKEKLVSVGIPTADFVRISGSEVRSYEGPFPIVQKWRRGGYDGSGVCIHTEKKSIQSAKSVDSIFESCVDIAMEVSVIVARSRDGDLVIYDPVEMVFDARANLVDYLIAPARLETAVTQELYVLTKTMAEKLDFLGLYAIEFFIDQKGHIYVNEISPRPHNSGHHTISTHITSQYEQQIRLALGLPLGSVDRLSEAVMVNLLSEEAQGQTDYKGLASALSIPNVQYTFYGKKEVRPFRKMGHALILEKTLEKALERKEDIRTKLIITAQ